MRVFYWIVLFTCFAAQAERYEWVTRFGGDNSIGDSIGLDAAGNVYLAGRFTGALAIGTNEFTSAGGVDVFFSKLSPDGAPIWAISAGSTNDDVAGRIAVGADGAMFVCGSFDVPAALLREPASNHESHITNVILARIDDGKFAWVDSMPEMNGSIAAVRFSQADQTLWAVGLEGFAPMLRRYDRAGTHLATVAIPLLDFLGIPCDIAVSGNGTLFLAGSKAIAALDSTGRHQWNWMPDDGYRSSVNALVLAPDGSLATAGIVQRSAHGGANYNYAFVAKHSTNGSLQWLTATGEHRGAYSPAGLAADSRGNLHLVGSAWEYYLSSSSRRGVLLLTLSPDGNVLNHAHINSYYSWDANVGGGIVCNAEGDIWFTGGLRGSPAFGLEVMGGGPSGILNAFAAWRRTVTPALTFRTVDSNLVISWPLTAVPFALQQSVDASSNSWLAVDVLPQKIDGGFVVTLRLESSSPFFRLVQTNDSPTNHAPSVWSLSAGGMFAGRLVVIIPRGSGSVPTSVQSEAWDPDPNAELSFSWFDGVTGEQIVPTETSLAVRQHIYDAGQYAGRPVYQAIREALVRYFPGTYSVSVTVSDGALEASKSVSFEVILFETALDQLIQYAERMLTTRKDRLALVPLKRVPAALERGKDLLALRRLKIFRRRVANSWELTVSADQVAAAIAVR